MHDCFSFRALHLGSFLHVFHQQTRLAFGLFNQSARHSSESDYSHVYTNSEPGRTEFLPHQSNTPLLFLATPGLDPSQAQYLWNIQRAMHGKGRESRFFSLLSVEQSILVKGPETVDGDFAAASPFTGDTFNPPDNEEFSAAMLGKIVSSDAQQLSNCLRHFADPPIIATHGYGCLLAQIVAERFPDRVRGLILLKPWPRPSYIPAETWTRQGFIGRLPGPAVIDATIEPTAPMTCPVLLMDTKYNIEILQAYSTLARSRSAHRPTAIYLPEGLTSLSQKIETWMKKNDIFLTEIDLRGF